jgi:predicted anti-sigma-YlaC factor YlaD
MRKLIIIAVSGLLLAGCSIKQTAVDIVGDALSGGGSAYAADDDPELVFEALPFGLKTYESMLEVSPEHRGLLLASAQGFTVYAYLIQNKADRLAERDLGGARRMRARARKLYLRGRDYALRGLAVGHEGFTAGLYEDRSATLARADVADAGFLYWGGAAWAGALSAAKDDLDLIAELPIAGDMVARVVALDEGYERGAAHEFFISYEGSRPGGSNGRAREHYGRALAVSGGLRASTHLALAEAVAVSEQNLTEFRALLEAALAVDPDRVPQLRLANTIARERAQWLKGRIPDLFLEAGSAEEAQ